MLAPASRMPSTSRFPYIHSVLDGCSNSSDVASFSCAAFATFRPFHSNALDSLPSPASINALPKPDTTRNGGKGPEDREGCPDQLRRRPVCPRGRALRLDRRSYLQPNLRRKHFGAHLDDIQACWVASPSMQAPTGSHLGEQQRNRDLCQPRSHLPHAPTRPH